MSSLEPRDVGPIVGGDQPATALDRARAVDLLQRAQAMGQLPPQEAKTRIALAQRADTIDDLVPLTRGLDIALPAPMAGPALPVPVAPPVNLPAILRDGADTHSDRLIGIFGGSNRTGVWRVRKQTDAYCLMGGHSLDLTHATFDDDEVVISIYAVMGGVDIKVPDGINLVNEMTCVFGGVDVKNVTPLPGGPTVRLTGFCFMGGVDVKGPRPGSLKETLKRAIDEF